MQPYASVADAACIDALHAALERLWAESADVDEMHRLRFATALSEIVANVVVHGRTADGGLPTLTVRLAAGPGGLRADLVDDGVALARRMTWELPADELAETGRGLAIAREALDELHYARVDGANHWALVVRPT
jgi:serine/threonine-protein kinase RsbW